MILPDHFFDDEPSYNARLTQRVWCVHSRNPTPEVLQTRASPFDERMVRARTYRLCNMRYDRAANAFALVERHASRAFAQKLKPHCYSTREAAFWLLFLLDTETLRTQEELEVRIETCLLATSEGKTLSEASSRDLLITWIDAHITHPSIGQTTLRGVALLLRDLYGMRQAIDIMLDLAPPELLARGLKPLATYTLKETDRTHVNKRVTDYLSVRGEKVPIDTEVELIRLAPTLSQVVTFLQLGPIHRDDIHDDHRHKVLASIQDAELFEACMYGTTSTFKEYTRVHLDLHMYHLGPRRLDLALPHISTPFSVWKWRNLFSIRTPDLTEFMLRLAHLTLRLSDGTGRRRAIGWLYEGGKLVVARCIEIALGLGDDDDLIGPATRVLQRYAQLGHHEMVHTLLDDSPHARPQDVTRLKALCPVTPSTRDTSRDILDDDSLPGWLVTTPHTYTYYANKITHLSAERCPKLCTRRAPGLYLSTQAITLIFSVLRRRRIDEIERVGAWLDQPSREALGDYLYTIWQVQPSRYDDWIGMSCGVFISHMRIAHMLETGDFHNTLYMDGLALCDPDMLMASAHPEVIAHLIQQRIDPKGLSAYLPYTTRKRFTQIADLWRVHIITMLTRHMSRHHLVHHGIMEVNSPHGQIQVTCDDEFNPIFTPKNPAVRLTPEQLATLRDDPTFAQSWRAIHDDIYMTQLPHMIERGSITWSYHEWRSAMAHPLVGQLHRAILWQVITTHGQTTHARCLEDFTLYDVDDMPLASSDLCGCSIQVAHIKSMPASERTQWGVLFAEEELHLLFQAL